MILETNRLKIVSLSCDELVEYVKDHKGFVKGEEEEKKVWDYTVIPMLKAPIEEQIFYTFWCGYYEGTDVLQCGFLRPVNENGVVEIWMHVADEYMNKGFGTEGINALVDWIEGYSDVLFVGASIDKDNYASKKMVTKCGFEYGGEHKGVDIYYKKLKNIYNG